MSFCPNCGKQVSGDARFCENCGQKLPTSFVPFCPNCGEKVPADARFCEHCGQRLVSTFVPPPPYPSVRARPERKPIRKTALIASVIIIIALIAAFTFLLRPRAEFEVSSIGFSPSKIFVGDHVTISADVKNIGNAKGTYEANLTVGGIKVETKEVTIDAGGVKTVNFIIIKDTEGNYTIKIGERTATLIVKPKIFLGAYLQYKVEGLALIIPISGTIRVEVTDITQASYTISMTPSGIPFVKPETKTYRLNEIPAGLSIGYPMVITNMDYIGEEVMSTAIGTKKVIHYRSENVTETGTTTTDAYLDKGTKLPLLVTGTGPSFWIAISISETNIEWLLSS